MKNKKELKNKILNEEQVSTVREMIIASMRNVYTDQGIIPSVDLNKAAGFVADKIIKNTQMALIQNNVYARAVANSIPLKKGKITKVTTKKHVRK